VKNGILAATTAYFVWGLFPIYWKWLQEVPALQIMAHRVLWCALFVGAWLAATGGFRWLRALPRQVLLMLCGSCALIGVNWWLYIWAVNNGHIVETSLGYFINPLVSVLLGVLLLRERLNTAQWAAFALATAGVLWLTVHAGRLPWISLALAFSFGGYGLLRKLAVVPAVQGLMVESGLLLLPALAILGFAEAQGQGSFGHGGAQTDVLLMLAGVVTAVPLILFAYGARRIPLSLVGILQYIAPSLQLMCGVLIYQEPFTSIQLTGFACIWGALLIYASDGLWRSRRQGSSS